MDSLIRDALWRFFQFRKNSLFDLRIECLIFDEVDDAHPSIETRPAFHPFRVS